MSYFGLTTSAMFVAHLNRIDEAGGERGFNLAFLDFYGDYFPSFYHFQINYQHVITHKFIWYNVCIQLFLQSMVWYRLFFLRILVIFLLINKSSEEVNLIFWKHNKICKFTTPQNWVTTHHMITFLNGEITFTVVKM